MTGLGFIVFGDVPDGWTMVGASIICISGIYIMNRERQIARNERKLAARLTRGAVEGCAPGGLPEAPPGAREHVAGLWRALTPW